MPKLLQIDEYLLAPEPQNTYLSRPIFGINQDGTKNEFRVVEERPLTIFLNSQEIVTAMTIGDHPKFLAIGFLFNQKMIRKEDTIERIDYDSDLSAVVVRTAHETNFEEKLQKRTKTSGCAVGTIFGDMMEGLDDIRLEGGKLNVSWMQLLTSKINRTPSLYLETGAIHGTILCKQEKPLVYMEDVGRHNAVDKISGWMILNNVSPKDKILYTTGRLTSEMVIKTAYMGIPILISRSGFTAWGVELAKKVGLTLIGRMKGRRFVCLSGEDRLVFD